MTFLVHDMYCCSELALSIEVGLSVTSGPSPGRKLLSDVRRCSHPAVLCYASSLYSSKAGTLSTGNYIHVHITAVRANNQTP